MGEDGLARCMVLKQGDDAQQGILPPRTQVQILSDEVLVGLTDREQGVLQGIFDARSPVARPDVLENRDECVHHFVAVLSCGHIQRVDRRGRGAIGQVQHDHIIDARRIDLAAERQGQIPMGIDGNQAV